MSSPFIKVIFTFRIFFINKYEILYLISVMFIIFTTPRFRFLYLKITWEKFGAAKIFIKPSLYLIGQLLINFLYFYEDLPKFNSLKQETKKQITYTHKCVFTTWLWGPEPYFLKKSILLNYALIEVIHSNSNNSIHKNH